jgi:hypothetical protein
MKSRGSAELWVGRQRIGNPREARQRPGCPRHACARGPASLLLKRERGEKIEAAGQAAKPEQDERKTSPISVWRNLFFRPRAQIGGGARDLCHAPVDGYGLAEFDRPDEHGRHDGHDQRKLDGDHAAFLATAAGMRNASANSLPRFMARCPIGPYQRWRWRLRPRRRWSRTSVRRCRRRWRCFVR